MYSTTVTTKGQVVIPQEIRDKMGIKPGSKIKVSTKGNTIVFHINDYQSKLSNFRSKVRSKLQKSNKSVSDEDINQAKTNLWQAKK